ncbi:hypothetical protein SBOR_0546 [Sclerotinia borealis F-4128]|uniref:Uncharacterized protein n=1 Tax=Sclerotinia borealis (strain F-4128) TaxID=1432307 RepID=W9CTC3_SCLBF|nr:hypothetical protein SBOR_0546 [Sclerotinia borealis F-4128]
MADIDFSQYLSPFSLLPAELIETIISFMDLSSIKATRLTCKVLCIPSTPHLVPPHFHSFAHCPDSNRLLQISRHPIFSLSIKTLELNLGEFNEYRARHNTYFSQITRDPETRVAEAEEAWFQYSKLKSLREEYAPWMCDQTILSEVFRSLPNLSALSVSMVNFPLPNEPELALLASIWKIPSTRLLRRELTKERFTNVLSSLLPSVENLKLKNLSHDCLPFEFFAQNKTLIESMTPIFHKLTDLRLVLDYSDTPNDLHSQQALANLATCLQAAATLENLNLCFQSRRKIDITSLLENLLSNSIFSHLQSLHIEGLASAFYPLEQFLRSLAPNLQVLEFGGAGCHGPNQLSNGGIHLLDGRFLELFKNVEEALGDSLTKFVVRGDLVEVDGGDAWFLDREVGWHGVIN